MSAFEGKVRAFLFFSLLAGIALLAYGDWRLRALERELEARPPLAVLAVDATVIRLLDENPGMTAEQAVGRVREAGRRLAESGYVVLDAPHVYGYPAEIEARP